MLVVTVRFPVVVVAVQVTENVVESVPPAGTVTVREGPPLTLQFPATSESVTA